MGLSFWPFRWPHRQSSGESPLPAPERVQPDSPLPELWRVLGASVRGAWHTARRAA